MAEGKITVNSKCKGLFVVAINIGSTYSGYAFSHKDDWRRIHTNLWCGGHLIFRKAPTALLLDKDKKFVAFGFEAEDKYSMLVQMEEHGQYYYFQRFKMAIHNEKIGRKAKIVDYTGKSLDATSVFMLLIEYLKTTSFSKIRHDYPDAMMSDIDFYLTVPATWHDACQQFMREAALQAGIQEDQLTLLSEPAAASIYCQYLNMACSDEISQSSSLGIFPNGTKFMVVKLGGRKADFTVHRKCVDNILDEVHPPSSGLWGGESIDDNFEQFLKDIIGSRKYGDFKENNMEDYIDLFRNFETKKRTVNPNKLEDGNTHLTVPVGFTSCVKGGKKGMETAISQSKYAETVSFEKGKFKWRNKNFANFFQNTIQHILDHIKEMFQYQNVKDVNIIFLVGGFSECKLVQHSIQKKFPSKRVVVSEDSGIAVLNGAVYFGHIQPVTCKTVLQKTYGIQSCPEWNYRIHPDIRQIRIGDTYRCSDVFLKYASKGQSIWQEHSQSHTFNAVKLENYLECAIYVSNKENPQFVDEDGCRRLCLIRIDLPNLPMGATKELEGTMIFGRRDVRVRITDLHSYQLYSDVTIDL